MKKKERNRKKVSQNLRNRLLNRRYKNLAKAFLKITKEKINIYINSTNVVEKKSLKEFLEKIGRLFKSTLDKSVKKKVFHKNTVARKKSRLLMFLNKKVGEKKIFSF